MKAITRILSVSTALGQKQELKKGNNGVSVEIRGPIRKLSPAERPLYMREYMRAYRLRNPGLSTQYVRKYRARKGHSPNVAPRESE
jgi:hypothetical protein